MAKSESKTLQSLLRQWSALAWAGLLLALPTLILLPLGAVWLWQEGWLWVWLIFAALLAALAYLPSAWQRWRTRHSAPAAETAAEPPDTEHAPDPPDPHWAPRDLAAWQEVLTIAQSADPNVVTDWNRALHAARSTIERVAQHYRPEVRDPVWSFTLPELLLLAERVSIRLRTVLMDHVPAAHLIEAGHLWRVWEFKPMATSSLRIAKHLHTLWRVSRLVNPMTAILSEARQRLVDATLNEADSYLRREGSRIWVEEVGRAAIDLYSGRLRIDPERLRAYAAQQTAGPEGAETTLPGPVRLLIAGRVNAGKSSLLNALLGHTAAGVAATRLTTRSCSYRLEPTAAGQDRLPFEGLVVDTPGLGSAEDFERLIQHAWESDCLLWVYAADGQPSELDTAALTAIRQRFAADPRRNLIPLLVVVSRIDCLPPIQDWSPPYVLSSGPGDSKLEAIRDNITAVARRLAIPPADVIGAKLDPLDATYNLDAIRDWLIGHYPAMQRTRAQRLQTEMPERNWRQVIGQAVGAGKLLKRRILGR